MTNPELGTKRDCPECGARFYDLGKEPAECPKCGHEFIPEALLKPRKARVADEEKPADGKEAEKPEAEVSLADADEESKQPQSNRKAGLDDEEDTAEDELAEFEDVELEDDDTEPDDDTTILQNDDDDDDMAGLVGPTGDDDNDA